MSSRPLPQAAENIRTVARLEQEFLERRTTLERIADAIGAFVGTMAFVSIHLALFAFWVTANLGLIPHVKPFDPFPFLLLGMAVSIEGVLLTTFVLMKQNRMSKRADERNQLNLQIDLLAEREITKMLQMLAAICDRLGLEQHAREDEVTELSQHTAVDELARELREKLPD
jgi:uncharacterized membrane protein